MKEDKLDKEIAASLREKLVEASVPYELGAWENFQKKRVQRKRKAIAFWASGIAASLLLLAVGLNSVDFSENENSSEIQLAEKVLEEILNADSEVENSLIEKKSGLATPEANQLAKSVEDSKPQVTTSAQRELGNNSRREENTAGTAHVKSSQVAIEKTLAEGKEHSIPQGQPLIVQTEEMKEQLAVKSTEESLGSAKEEESINPIENPKFVAESDFPEIQKDKTSVGLGMGLSPGFGAIQTDNQTATASTIGLGMLVDIKLPGKFTLGSGLGLNYLNQSTQQENMVMAFGNSYPQTEKLDVRQMQLEVPVFVKYPLTKNNSVSIQAGFSNFYALNESANQENTVQKQSAFYANDAMGSSAVSLRQQTVTESATLESKSGKFYPFASLNLGVNLRVLETKGANYVIMPFYNYQLKQVSGYGDTYGLFGASFKMNFGGK